MPDNQVQGAPNNEWQDKQWAFNGAWMPDEDPALIGPDNFAVLQNLRYTDTAVEGVSGYTKYNTTAVSTYTNIDAGIQLEVNKTLSIPSYTLFHAQDSGGQGRVFLNTTAVDSEGDYDSVNPLDSSGNAYFADTSTNALPRFSKAPQGSVVYCNGEDNKIYSGREGRIAAAFLTTNVDETVATTIKDRTIQLQQSTTTNVAQISSTNSLLVLTTRPVRAFKAYVNASSSPASVAVTYYNGSTFAAVAGFSDGTSNLSATGTMSFTHTKSAAKLYHFQELYLYAYNITLASGTSDLYHLTADFALQDIVDVWDGVYRQPIAVQKYDGTVWSDYTLFANEPSTDLTSPIGAELGGLAAGSGPFTGPRLELMFDEPQTAFKFLMASNRINTAASTVTIGYWNGTAYTTVGTVKDRTLNGGTKSLSQTGIMSFQAPASTAIEKVTKFGVTGYAYCLQWSAQLQNSGDPSGDGATAANNVIIDVITAIPEATTLKKFKWSQIFNNRLMLGNFDAGREGNRMDFSVANAPDVWNGFDSSMDGYQSLYFGGDEPINGAAQLYNRFGASIYSMLMVFKDTEVYLVVGDSPEDFVVYPVSDTVGCPAPNTIATAELGMDLGQNITRNVVLWLSHSGPMMFDGATISKIEGIDSYFQPSTDNFIEWDALSKASGWFDNIFKEYNLIIPSSGSSTQDIWLVYDLKRKKWFTKATLTASFPQSTWPCTATTGEEFIFCGCFNGRKYKLERGTSWDGVGITQRLRTGDFWPSQNIWDETLLRKFKIVCKKITEADDKVLEILYYQNTSEDSGAGAIFQDVGFASGGFVSFISSTDESTTGVDWGSATTSTFELSLSVGLQRLVRLIQDLNRKGWAHAFEFRITTDDVSLGWKPVFWGVQYRVERKDNTATQ